ncbi:hypothetical protein P261_01028 [Lachnospiraceae bacterium TWA4]|nr:hypothetical protein P261_01028 [Lachnospiraceae bacterium TWA4]
MVSLLSVCAPKETLAASTKYVNVSSAVVRSKASTKSSKLGSLKLGKSVKTYGSKNKFYKIKYKGRTAYIAKSSLSSKKVSTKTSKSSSSSKGSQVASYALRFVGNPYRWGGTSLTRGADCSGFIKAVYARFGRSLPHSSSALRRSGKGVSYSKRKAGDIICYRGHVALYIGNNKIVHAANTRRGIIVSKVSYMKVLAVRRIFS